MIFIELLLGTVVLFIVLGVAAILVGQIISAIGEILSFGTKHKKDL